ncbi:solute symporter family protein [Amycolatopsis pithecellobii]|uniref:Cation acetate symporter n=1 Tax=Amycolatopsis pithecellobii TaxID=664692 RepID=A0A6N7Z4C6_9PSEU|nr:cation acetate symporter [Amycolatopsis pithecellobii]MTD55154.1 cation acetate symporter [Amycolatopsis pithecellobii]
MSGKAVALILFTVLVVVGMVLTYLAGRRTRTAGEFWAAGGAISPARNAIATLGDFMSGSALLGGIGLMFLVGYDALFYLVLPLLAWIPIMLLVAERLRNLGEYTLTDVLVRRFRSGSFRIVLAISTLVITGFYLLAQLVVAGNLFALLSGMNYTAAVVLTGVIMVLYVAIGGMHGATVIQVVKAVLLLTVLFGLSVLLLVRFGGDIGGMVSKATAPNGGMDPLKPGNLLKSPWNMLSVSLAATFGVAGLPHVMMRFFTVRDAVHARRSVTMTVAMITVASVLIAFVGLGASALLRPETKQLAATGGNLVTPRLAEALGGATTLGIVSAIAFATVVAVVSGLLVNASSAVVRDIWSQFGRARSSDREVGRGRIATVAIGILVVAVAVALGPGFNATVLVTLAFGIAASTNVPVLLFTLTWRRFTKTGAITGVLTGLTSSVVLMLLGPTLWPGSHPPISLSDPTLIALPLGIIGCVAGTLLSRRQAAGEFEEIQIESELGRRSVPAHAD